MCQTSSTQNSRDSKDMKGCSIAGEFHIPNINQTTLWVVSLAFPLQKLHLASIFRNRDEDDNMLLYLPVLARFIPLLPKGEGLPVVG